MSTVPASLPTGLITRTPHLVVTIDGQLVDAVSADTHHGVNRPKGTATVTALRPASTETDLRDRWINKRIEIQAGYDELGGARRIFSGRVAQIGRSWGERGSGVEIRARGWASLLDWGEETDLVYGADTLLYDVVRSLCTRRGIPQFGGEQIVYPDGVTPVRLGGVMDVDGGEVILPKRRSLLSWVTGALELFGYRGFDRPDGFFWWQLVSGEPAATPAMAFAQADNVIDMSREDDIDGTVTWWDVEGASYTDSDGVPVKIRSFPVTVPPYPYDPPPDFVRDEIRDDLLVTQALADAARNRAEIDYAGPYETDSWSFLGENTVQPGDVVGLTAPALELDDVRRWVLTTDHSVSDGRFRTTWTGWAGAGAAIPGGDDSDEIPVVTGPAHIGDEYLSHYGRPSPQGKRVSFTINVPDTYTALVLEFWHHGTNSFLLGGANTDSEVSKVEVFQNQGQDDPSKPVGSATMPVVPENLERRLPYSDLPVPGNNKHWKRERLPIPGRLEQGTARVEFVSGEDRRIGDAYKFDDYEVYGVVLVVTGNGYPVLPGVAA